jgi:2,3-bisphosphoglycerate-dependent phosphoglycerate mutase
MPEPRPTNARVVLLRHGESTWNERKLVQGQLDDARLSAEGKSQASAVAETLRDFTFQWIVTSDLTRARETAAIVDDALGLEVAIAPALRERSYGVYEGRPVSELPSSMTGIEDGRVVDPSARPEGGESLDDLYGRCAKFVDSLGPSEPSAPTAKDASCKTLRGTTSRTAVSGRSTSALVPVSSSRGSSVHRR